MHIRRATFRPGNLVPAVAIAVLGATFTIPAQAQAKFGGQVSLSSDDYHLGLGIREWVPVARNLDVIGSFDCFFRAARDVAVDGSLDAAYRSRRQAAAAEPYVGAGLAVVHYPVTYKATRLGLNLLGGMRFQQRGFIELRFRTTFDASSIMLATGLFF